MRLFALLLPGLAAALSLTGCRSGPPAALPAQQPAQPVASQPHVAQTSPGPPSAQAAAPAPAVASRAKPKSTPSAQDIAQLDLDGEGGVRDGSYAMWVHVARHGAPLKNVMVIALNDANKPVAAARTNADGDAMLKVQATTYRIAATMGRLRTEQTVTFHPGDQFELDLQP